MQLFTHHGRIVDPSWCQDNADTLSTLYLDDNVWHSLVTLKIETFLVGQPQTQSNDLVQYLIFLLPLTRFVVDLPGLGARGD